MYWFEVIFILQKSKDMTKVVTMHANCCTGLGNKIQDLRRALDSWERNKSIPPPKEFVDMWRVPAACRHSKWPSPAGRLRKPSGRWAECSLSSNYGTLLYLTPSRQGVSRSIDMSYPPNAKYQIYSGLSSSVEDKEVKCPWWEMFLRDCKWSHACWSSKSSTTQEQKRERK